MPLFLSHDDVDQLLTMKDTMEALEILYREMGEGAAVTTPRSDVHSPTAAAQSAEGPMAHYLKSMSGASPYFGTAALRFSSDIVAWRASGGGMRREKFAKETASGVGVEIVPVESYEEAVKAVDIIITSTNSRTPFLGKWALAEGIHISAMQRDEFDDEALLTCKPLVLHTHATENNVTSSALAHFEREDFKLRDHPTDRGIDWKSLPTLPDLLAGKVKGRQSDSQITGFVNNIGMGAQFAPVGEKVYDAAKAKGAGREVPLDW